MTQHSSAGHGLPNAHRFLESALAYTRIGWRVIPLLPRSKKPYVVWKQFQATAPTEEQVREWWTRWPDANIGLLTGAGTNLVVLDTDSGEAEEALLSAYGPLPPTPTSKTAKGRHRLFAQTQPPIGNSVGLLPEVDVRGQGGYIVAPPSIHPSGHEYKWENGLGPDTALASLPGSLLSIVKEREQSTHAVTVSPRQVENGPSHILAALKCEGPGPQWTTLCPAHGDSTPSLSVRLAPNGNLLLKCHAGCSTGVILKAIGGNTSDLFAAPSSEEGAKLTVERSTAFRFFSIAELFAFEPTAWLVEGVLPSKGLAFVYAPPATYKSFFCLDMALCVALGLPWHGREVQQGPVVYVAAEGNAPEIALRIRAWAERYGSAEAAQFHCLTSSIDLGDPGSVERFLASLPEPRPRLIVIDTLARCTNRLDENRSTDMGRAVALTDRLREATGATVVLVHHSRKHDSEMRGSGALEAAADTSILLAKAKASRVVRIECEKQKDAPEFADFTLELHEQGASAVLVEVSPSQRSTAKGDRLNPNDEKLVRVMSPEGMRYKEWQRSSVLGGSSFDDSRKRLLELGIVFRDEKGVYRLASSHTVVGAEGSS